MRIPIVQFPHYENEVNLDKTPNFYATNRKEWETKRILTTYLDRWPTVTFNEDAKGNLSFEDHQLRQLKATRRHWYLSFVAYSLLGDQGPPGRTRWGCAGPVANNWSAVSCGR